ncbi:hypothetical protein D9757_004715 [Collybiopsis confluens]|uniref:Riboflavin synthase n=1 Tax=Collybiopsis confluens TaxID=2823264 RepID=A0A8H5HS50_9AGAR|nr:hypothetical protein D9757_004715 [Collybiopsis confluens]
MFTGLIELLGTVSHIEVDSGGATLVITDSAPILDDCHIGDSIAVNGCCLTVTEFDKVEKGGWFKVWLANETLERSDLGERVVGDQLNLERAMSAETRFGGHFVQGHVDSTATIIDRTPDGDSLRLRFQLPKTTPSLIRYLIAKGFIAIDGASLTLTEVTDSGGTFGVMLIQHTQEKITLSKKGVGAKVNIEVDSVAKYIEKGVVAALSSEGSNGLRAMVEKVVEDTKGALDSPCVFSSSDLNSAKVTSKLSYNDNSKGYRPPSPAKSTSPPALIRPKAKVNSSATPASARAKITNRPLTAVVSRTPPPPSSIPRPASPTKSSLASQKPRIARTQLRPQPSSTPGTPVSAHLSVEPDSESKPRYAASLAAWQTSPPLGLGLSNGSLGSASIFSPLLDDTADLPVRIKSKISRVALTSPDYSISPRPSHPSGFARVRAPSISSALSLNSTTSSNKPEYTHYPTTTTTATNLHRYAPTRPAEPSPSHNFQSFSAQDDVLNRMGYKVDPSTIPLPTHSPPTSALSFSSKSSVSRSSISHGESSNAGTSVSTSHTTNPLATFDIRTTLDSLVHISELNPSPRDELLSPTDDDAGESEDRKARHEAKVNRKIADLEITNRSLLAINSSLEATKHRQAKEIRDLRRKLRESRLILPPRTYRAVTSDDNNAKVQDDDDDDDDEEEEDNVEEDQTYMRIRLRLDEMIESAKIALATKPGDYTDVKGSAKVLNEQEVRVWRGGGDAGDTSLLLEVDEDERNDHPSTGVSSSSPPETTEEITSEDEVEALTMPRDSPSPPPIVVTHSP